MPWALEQFYFQHLENSGKVNQIKLFTIQGQFHQDYFKSIFHKLYFRLKSPNIYRKLNYELLQEIEIFLPTHLWVFKGMEIFPETLQKISAKGIKLINYNPDNPFFFSGRGSGNKNVTNSIGLYDLHLTYNLSVLNQLLAIGQKARWLPFGFESNVSIFEECKRETEIVKVCFVGNPDRLRENFLKALADHGVAIDVFGKRWKVKHPLIELFDPVYGIDYWKTLYKYRIQLNPLRPHNPTSHGMRSFEVPGIGGILLTPETIEHTQFFLANEEAFYYTDIPTCLEKIRYLLKLSSAEAECIRDKARNRSLGSKYDYNSRALEALHYISEI